MDVMTKLRAQWDRTAAGVLAALGGIFLLAGWIGTSGTPHIAAQLPYMISGGIGGMFLLAMSATLWLSADLRDQWRELRRLRIAQEATLETAQTAAQVRIDAEPLRDDDVVPTIVVDKPRRRRATAVRT